MAAFSGNNADLPFVPEMLEVRAYMYTRNTFRMLISSTDLKSSSLRPLLQISSTWDFTNVVKGLY